MADLGEGPGGGPILGRKEEMTEVKKARRARKSRPFNPPPPPPVTELKVWIRHCFNSREIRYRDTVSWDIARRHSGVKQAFMSVVSCFCDSGFISYWPARAVLLSKCSWKYNVLLY